MTDMRFPVTDHFFYAYWGGIWQDRSLQCARHMRATKPWKMAGKNYFLFVPNPPKNDRFIIRRPETFLFCPFTSQVKGRRVYRTEAQYNKKMEEE